MIFFLTAFSWHLYNCWMPEVMDKGLRYYWHQKWDPWWTSLAASDKNQLSWTGWASWASWASWVEGSLCKAHEQDHPKIRWTFVTINALRERFSWWHLQKLTTRGDLIRKGWNRFEATEFHVFLVLDVLDGFGTWRDMSVSYRDQRHVLYNSHFFRIVCTKNGKHSSNFFSRSWAFVTDNECKSCQCLLAYQKRRECLFVAFVHRWLSQNKVPKQCGTRQWRGRMGRCFANQLPDGLTVFCWESPKKDDVWTRRAGWFFSKVRLILCFFSGTQGVWLNLT